MEPGPPVLDEGGGVGVVGLHLLVVSVVGLEQEIVTQVPKGAEG